MNGVVAYVLAKNIAASAVSGVKNYSVDGTTLKIETNDGNVLEMVFPVPTGIDKGYYNDENGKFYRDSEFENEIVGKTDVVYIDHGQNRLCFWDGEKFDAIGGGSASSEDIITNYTDLENKPKIAGVTLTGNKSLSDLGIQGVESGKGLSTNDYTNEEKAKLAGLSNYDDTSLSNRITDVESNKVDKVEGKGLSANDFTDAEKTKLAGLSNYDDTSITNRVSNLEGIVPNSASSSNKLATLEDIPSGPNGTTNYNSLENKPQIGGITLTGDKSLTALGIQPSEEGKGLSTNDFTNTYKDKLDNLSNYDDTNLSERLTEVEDVIPSGASSSNKLATMDDIPETDDIDYNSLSALIAIDNYSEIEEGKTYILGEGAKTNKNNNIQVKCLSIENSVATMQTYGVTASAWPGDEDLTESYSNYFGNLTSAITETKLPTGIKKSSISPKGAQTVLPDLSYKASNFGSTHSCCWLGTEKNDEEAYYTLYQNEGPYSMSKADLAICAPYFKLNLAKVLVNDGVIELNPTYQDANASSVISKIETKLNNRYTKDEIDTTVNNKVDKVSGKGLSTEDYTTEEKTKLAGLTNYDDSVLAGRVSELEGVIPGSASAENKLATMADIPTGSSGGSGVGTSDYLALNNKPQIAGVTLSGNRTLADLGIQPVEEGKGLSTNDFSDEEKAKLAGLINYDDTALDNRVSNVENTLSDKVDKDGSKGLSTNDFTTEEKNKLAELNNYDDTALSGRVTNIENIIPSTVSEENKLATIADIPTGEGNESSNTFNTADFDITEQGEVSLKPSQRAWIGTREEWDALSTEEKAKYGGIISITDDPNELDNKVDKIEGKGLSTNDYTNEEKTKLAGLSNYDDTEISNRVQGLENIVPESASNENKLATIKDINDIPIITSSDIDRLWEMTFEDGDKEEY